MRSRTDAFDVFILMSSILSFIECIFYYGKYADGYHTLVIFPITFLLLYFPVLKTLRLTGFPFTAYGLIGMQWIRFVLMPPLCAVAGEDPGYPYINPRVHSLELATRLMLYEFFIVWLFCIVWLTFAKRKQHPSEVWLSLGGSRPLYLTFLLIALGVYLVIGVRYDLVHFFYIPVKRTGRVGDPTNTYLVLARQILTIGLFLTFLWMTSYAKPRYDKTGRTKYVWFAVVGALLNVAAIVGERRTAQIYAAIVSIYILCRVFPMHRKLILLTVGATALSVLLVVSIYKFFLAFQYGSYLAALTSSHIDFAWLSRMLQGYFFGPENIAAVIDFSEVYDTNILRMLYDFMRSTFGLSFILKGQGVLTSEAFNTYIYGIPTSSGHVISAVGYGYLYLGMFLSPVFTLINIIVSLKLEKKMYTSRSYEMTYLWGYALARFCTNLFVNTPPLVSYSTIMFGTAGLLFCIARIFNGVKRDYNSW